MSFFHGIHEILNPAQMTGVENFLENEKCEDDGYASSLENNHADQSRRLKN